MAAIGPQQTMHLHRRTSANGWNAIEKGNRSQRIMRRDLCRLAVARKQNAADGDTR